MAAQDSYSKAVSESGPSFESLVSEHYGPLYRFAMSLTRMETEAADLVQDTFLTWAEKGSQLKDPARAKAWLFTTLHRRFLQSQRHIARFQHLEVGEADEELPSVHPDLVNRLDGQAIVGLLNQLHPQYRAAVALFYLEDCTHAEMASILEVPVGTVKSRISRGLAQLKELISQRAPHQVDFGRHQS